MNLGETYRPPHVAPECGETGAVEFPFDEVFARLDGAQKILCGMSDEIRSEVADALHELNQILVAGALQKKNPAITIGRTYILLNWILNPAAFADDGPIPLRKVAALLGIKPNILAPLSAELTRRFGIRNGYQVHNWRGRIRHDQSKSNQQPEHNEPGDDEQN